MAYHPVCFFAGPDSLVAEEGGFIRGVFHLAPAFVGIQPYKWVHNPV